MVSLNPEPIFQDVVEIVIDNPGWHESRIDEHAILRPAAAVLSQLERSPGQAAMTILLTGDGRVQELNAAFRDKDSPANVLSFPSGDDGYIGDIALAFETVVREAAEQGLSMADHTSHLVVHGILHLLGYDHQTDEDAKTMEQLEVTVLMDLGIADPDKTRDPGVVEISSVDGVA